jgi:ABC-type glycerol-3-phosphate transport system substrate-binding protein
MARHLLYVVVLLTAWGALAQTPSTKTLTLGFNQVFRARLPLEDFGKANADLVLKEVAWPRNVLRWYEPPLPQVHAELPVVFFVTAGSLSEDVRVLAERRLLAPAVPMLQEAKCNVEDFAPGLIEAFSHDGVLYAIPYHVTVPTLRYNRAVFNGAGLLPKTSSWEELLAAAEPMMAKRGQPGPRRLFSAPYTRARLAEIMALSAGAPPLDLADPVFLTSAPYQKALRLVIDAVAANRIHLQQANTPMRADGGIILGVDFVASVEPDSEFGVAEMPTRVLAADAAAEVSRVPAVAEGLALRNFSPADRPGALRLAQWLFSPEAEWRAFELSNPREPSKDWLLDSVHVPLHSPVLSSIDFEYGLRKFPDLALLRAHVAKAYIPKRPAALEARVWELLEAKIDYLKAGEELAAALAALEQEVRELVRTTAVPSAAFAEY